MIALSPRAIHRIRILEAVVIVAVAAGFGFLAFEVGLPRNPEGGDLGSAIEVPAQIVLLGIVVTGWLTSRRLPALGSVLIAFGGLGLGIVAAVEYPPAVTAAIMVAFALPAALVWLTWQHQRSFVSVGLLAVATTVVLVAEVAGSTVIYNHYFGPAHPSSDTAAIAADAVDWVWTGDLRDDGLTAVVRTVRRPAAVSLSVVDAVSGEELTTASIGVDELRLARVRVEGLAPDRKHTFTVNVDDRPDQGRGHGSFTTAPTLGDPASFTVAVASCARTASNGAVYDAIRAVDPLLYLISGDLHYANLSSTSPGDFVDAIGRAVTSPAQAALYRDVPVDYVWDDHDYGPNDADATAPSRTAARTSFRAAAPHPPMAINDGPGGGAIYHAFTIGRVRFLVTDTRSERTESTILGAAQERWLIDELRGAAGFGAVVWVNPDPWIAAAEPGRDDWGGYPDDRARIADAIAEAGVTNLVMLAGDAHMVALDDGSNTDFSTRGGGGFPLLHAGALDRPGSLKGGPYSEGAFPGAGQFGVVRIDDDGTDVRVTLEGRDWTEHVLVRRTLPLTETVVP